MYIAMPASLAMKGDEQGQSHLDEIIMCKLDITVPTS